VSQARGRKLPALVTTETPTGAVDFANRQLLDCVGAGLDELQDWPQFIDERDRSMMIGLKSQKSWWPV